MNQRRPLNFNSNEALETWSSDAVKEKMGKKSQFSALMIGADDWIQNCPHWISSIREGWVCQENRTQILLLFLAEKVEIEEDVLIFSRSAILLSILRLSLAHLANSSYSNKRQILSTNRYRIRHVQEHQNLKKTRTCDDVRERSFLRVRISFLSALCFVTLSLCAILSQRS